MNFLLYVANLFYFLSVWGEVAGSKTLYEKNAGKRSKPELTLLAKKIRGEKFCE
jgi:hypothetical protein